MCKQFSGASGVFGRDQIAVGEGPHGTVGDVLKIPDGGRDYVERAGRER